MGPEQHRLPAAYEAALAVMDGAQRDPLRCFGQLFWMQHRSGLALVHNEGIATFHSLVSKGVFVWLTKKALKFIKTGSSAGWR